MNSLQTMTASALNWFIGKVISQKALKKRRKFSKEWTRETWGEEAPHLELERSQYTRTDTK